MLNFSKISEEKANWLERPFEEAEIFGVVMDFDGDKAPGPMDSIWRFFRLVGPLSKLICWRSFSIFFYGQGDPLSPLLFVMVMIAFTKMLDKVVKDGLKFGFRVGPICNSV